MSISHFSQDTSNRTRGHNLQLHQGGDSGWSPGGISSLKGWPSTPTSCPGEWWTHYPRRCSRNDVTVQWFSCQGGISQRLDLVILELFFNLRDSVILCPFPSFSALSLAHNISPCRSPFGALFSVPLLTRNNFSATAQRRIRKMEINEINSLVAVRIMLQNKITCYAWKVSLSCTQFCSSQKGREVVRTKSN